MKRICEKCRKEFDCSAENEEECRATHENRQIFCWCKSCLEKVNTHFSTRIDDIINECFSYVETNGIVRIEFT